MTSRLPTEADILLALDWRLRAFSHEWVCKASGLIYEGVVKGQPAQVDEIALADYCESKKLPGDRRGGWSLGCALLASESYRRQAWALFWPAGFVVWQSWWQSQRGTHKRNPDALNELISAFRQNHPDATAANAFAHFCAMTTCMHPVLIDFDIGDDALLVLLRPGKQHTRISRRAFASRFSRLSPQVSQQPVAVKQAA